MRFSVGTVCSLSAIVFQREREQKTQFRQSHISTFPMLLPESLGTGPVSLSQWVTEPKLASSHTVHSKSGPLTSLPGWMPPRIEHEYGYRIRQKKKKLLHSINATSSMKPPK